MKGSTINLWWQQTNIFFNKTNELVKSKKKFFLVWVHLQILQSVRSELFWVNMSLFLVGEWYSKFYNVYVKTCLEKVARKFSYLSWSHFTVFPIQSSHSEVTYVFFFKFYFLLILFCYFCFNFFYFSFCSFCFCFHFALILFLLCSF